MKPGWTTTEFWTTCFAQLLALLTVVGVISTKDNQELGGAIANIVAAIAAILINGKIVFTYIKARTLIKLDKHQVPEEPTVRDRFNPNMPVAIACILALFASTAPIQAQSLLPWRNQIEQRLNDQNQLINQLISQKQAPAPAPYVEPKQPLPIQGEPKQLYPVPGEPKQPLPVPGDPKQPFPFEGEPKQPLPNPGAPKQPLPILLNPQAYTYWVRSLAPPVLDTVLDTDPKTNRERTDEWRSYSPFSQQLN